jgi:hypothetical protein
MVHKDGQAAGDYRVTPPEATQGVPMKPEAGGHSGPPVSVDATYIVQWMLAIFVLLPLLAVLIYELRPEAFANFASRFLVSGFRRTLRVALRVFVMNTF